MIDLIKSIPMPVIVTVVMLLSMSALILTIWFVSKKQAEAEQKEMEFSALDAIEYMDTLIAGYKGQLKPFTGLAFSDSFYSNGVQFRADLEKAIEFMSRHKAWIVESKGKYKPLGGSDSVYTDGYMVLRETKEGRIVSMSGAGIWYSSRVDAVASAMKLCGEDLGEVE